MVWVGDEWSDGKDIRKDLFFFSPLEPPKVSKRTKVIAHIKLDFQIGGGGGEIVWLGFFVLCFEC